MSGGRWDYVQSRLQFGLEEAGLDSEARERWPETTGLLVALAKPVYTVVQGMDYALSGDSDPDKLSDSAMAAEIRSAVEGS